ncbi:hypothetical protein E2C01_061069 [Portunus trituberculatus]|uniref:Uncharacterized protein n=1 Tax=Portunus trituberculatus TaxID=210409 RepID=A0A5B7HE28_PORTR|nr:hypothetical protein [Portunus trituberculatus]
MPVCVLLRPARNILHYPHLLRLLPRSPPLHLPSTTPFHEPSTSPSHEAPLLYRSWIYAAPSDSSESVKRAP